MAHHVSMRHSQEAADTAQYLVDIAGDYAPPQVAEVVTERLVITRDPVYWGGGHHCHHSDSNFWFWMWAFSSGNRPVVYHHYAPMGHAVGQGAWGASRYGGGFVAPQSDGMSGGERTAWAVLGAAIVALAVAFFDFFKENEGACQEKLDAAQNIKRKWEHAIPRSTEDKRVHECLMRVLNAQEKVESGRTTRASIYKWSCVVIGISGVALVIGAVVNSFPVVIAGVVVLVAAGVFAGVTALIAAYSGDAAESKKVVRDYQIVSRHFLLPPRKRGSWQRTCQARSRRT